MLKIEILKIMPLTVHRQGGLQLKSQKEQDPELMWEEETILLGRSDFSSTCGVFRLFYEVASFLFAPFL